MFNISMPYYDRDGYYTYDQVMEAFNYVKVEDPTDNQYQKNSLYNHLNNIREDMEHYHMDIILARDVLKYDEYTRAIVGDYRIIPIAFKSVSKEYIDLKVSAPRYRDAEFCGNCKHFWDETDYDDMLNGVCEIHTQLHEEYNPVLKVPMSLGCHGVCDDFEFIGE